MSYNLTELKARRGRARQRRRRRLQTTLALLTLAFAGAAAALALSGGSSAPAARSAASAGTPYRVGTAPRLHVRSRVARELAAARRIASYGLPVYCGGHHGRLIALTFDDGPGVYTRLAIKKLREAHLHATFFLVGKEIRAWPGLAQREKPYAAFGDHTMTHPFLPALPYAAGVQEIVAARTLIERTVREPVVLFRPPYEGMTSAINGEVKRLGMVEILWDVDSADSLGANYAGIERNVINGLRPGSIILMHENRGQTIRALPTIFAAIRRRHLHAVTVPQLITQDPPSLRQLRAGYEGCPVEDAHGSGS